MYAGGDIFLYGLGNNFAHTNIFDGTELNRYWTWDYKAIRGGWKATILYTLEDDKYKGRKTHFWNDK